MTRLTMLYSQISIGKQLDLHLNWCVWNYKQVFRDLLEVLRAVYLPRITEHKLFNIMCRDWMRNKDIYRMNIKDVAAAIHIKWCHMIGMDPMKWTHAVTMCGEPRTGTRIKCETESCHKSRRKPWTLKLYRSWNNLGHTNTEQPVLPGAPACTRMYMG